MSLSVVYELWIFEDSTFPKAEEYAVVISKKPHFIKRNLHLLAEYPMPNPRAEAFKNEGNNFFKSGKYKEAIEKYEEASKIDPSVPAYFSNAAACWEKLGDFEKMAEAGKNCIKADRMFVKGYFRLATAQKKLNQLSECIKTLENGLGIEASNADLKKMKKEITELQRGEQVAVHIAKASEQLQNGEIAAAMKTLELASRLDAGNADIERMMAKVKPKFEAMEAKRKASLSPTEAHKERGDDAYKNANFEVAVEHYTKCIDALKREGKGESELALKAYSNRAACYKQISNFDGTISDCTAVLEIDPENVKALVRRAQAFEGVERYRFALQDVKTVLTMPPSQVGKANLDICNMMQHRLNRTVSRVPFIFFITLISRISTQLCYHH
jgi:stress-induced-phosphoprotein 1